MKLLFPVLVAGLITSPAAIAKETERLLEPAKIGWSGATLQASKLFLSMEADIRLQRLPTTDIEGALIEPGEGVPVAPGDSVIEMNYATEGLGRHTDVTLLMDPESGSAIQRISEDSGNKQRYRVYRFTETGAYHRTRWPLTGEEKKPVSEWSDRSEGTHVYAEGAHGKHVTESTGLIYVAAAANLREPGDRLEILTYARRYVHRVILEVTESKEVNVDFDIVAPDGTGNRQDKLSPIRILIRGESLDDDGEDRFNLLGLRGDMELLLDPDTRLPLQLSGRAKVVGQVTFRLRKAVLN